MPKIDYDGFSMRNAYLYKECAFPLANQGLVLIRGLNLDDSGFLGAGKSTLLDAFARVQLGKGGKPDKANDIVNPFVGKDLEKHLRLAVNDHPYEICQYRKHTQWGTTVQVIDLDSGKDILPSEARKHPQAWIRDELLHIDETTFFSMVYLPQELNTALLTGKGFEKRQKLTLIFGLDVYDSFAEEVKSHEKLLETEFLKVTQSKQRLKEVTTQLKDHATLPILKRRLSKAKQRLAATEAGLFVSTKELETKQELLLNLKLRYNYTIEAKDLWDRSRQLHNLFTNSSALTHKASRKLDRRLEKLTSKKARLAGSLEGARRRAIIENQLKNFEAELTEVGGVEDCEATLSDNKTRLHHINVVELPAAEKRKALAQALHGLPKVPAVLEDLKAENEELSKTLTRLETRVRAISDQLSKGVCSECKRPFEMTEAEIKAKRRELDSLRLDLKDAKRRKFELKTILESAEKVAILKTQLDALPPTRPIDVILKESSKLLSQERKLARLVELARQQEKLRNQLETLPKHAVKGLEEREAALENKIQHLRLVVKAARRLAELNTQLATLPTGDRHEAHQVVKTLRLDIRSLSSSLKKLSAKTARLKSAIVQVEELTTTQTKLEALLASKQKLKNKLACYAVLKQAFGPKGLKQNRFRAILNDASTTTIPAYVNLLWSQRNVTLELADNEGLDFYLKRSSSSKLTKSALLSGGEKHKASLAFLLGLRDLKELYTDCSFNLLMIDEPFSGLDGRGSDALLSILEILKERFSSIFIITHRPEIVQSSVWDKTWVVVREHNQSKLYLENIPAKYEKLLSV